MLYYLPSLILIVLTNLLDGGGRELHLTDLEIKKQTRGFPGGAVVENLPANAGDTGSSPGLGRSHMPQSS